MIKILKPNTVNKTHTSSMIFGLSMKNHICLNVVFIFPGPCEKSFFLIKSRKKIAAKTAHSFMKSLIELKSFEKKIEIYIVDPKYL